MEVRAPSAHYALIAVEASEISDVGVIPRSWRVCSLGEIADVSAGGTPSRSVPSYWGEGVPWITTSEIDSSNIDSAAQSITREGLKNSAARLLRPGTLLLALYGQGKTRGKVGLLQIAAATNQACAAIEIDQTHSSAFVFHYLRAQYENIRKLSNTGNQENLSGAIVRSIKIPLPPPAEQQAIAEALSDADALIESLSLLLAKKRQIKQGAMQELLTGKKRLPGFRDEWLRSSLADITDRIMGGGTPSRTNPDYWGGCLPWMTVKDFADHSPDGTLEYITAAGLANSASNLVPAGNLITSTRMAIGKAVIFNVDVCINQDLKALFLKRDVDVHFLKHWFDFNESTLADKASGSTVLGISLNELRAVEFSKPSLPEQAAIAAALTQIDESVEAVRSKLAKATQLKMGMMQALLTGRIRLMQPLSNVVALPTRPAATKPPSTQPAHNWQINEAVVIGVLAQRFGSEKFPLPRKRRVKLTYLLHRHAEGRAEGYLKKAAGPYDPNTKYKGPEQIALKNGYVRALRNEKYEGFVAGGKIEQAQRYFEQWYGAATLEWLERFHYRKTDELELLATVDMAMVDLAASGELADVHGVKRVIAAHPEWLPKLSRELFSDERIAAAIAECQTLFGG